MCSTYEICLTPHDVLRSFMKCALKLQTTVSYMTVFGVQLSCMMYTVWSLVQTKFTVRIFLLYELQ